MVGVLLVLPAIALALTFKIAPLIRGFYTSFLVSQFGEAGQWAGLANYVRMVNDPKVQEAFLNAAKVVLTLPVWVILPLIVALAGVTTALVLGAGGLDVVGPLGVGRGCGLVGPVAGEGAGRGDHGRR